MGLAAVVALAVLEPLAATAAEVMVAMDWRLQLLGQV
tara:strand:+ start:521 stop:631 length:111 start_codon:yes stop_codon:yes gene_type:complete